MRRAQEDNGLPAGSTSEAVWLKPRDQRILTLWLDFRRDLLPALALPMELVHVCVERPGAPSCGRTAPEQRTERSRLRRDVQL